MIRKNGNRFSEAIMPSMEASILISGGNCHRFCHIGAQNRVLPVDISAAAASCRVPPGQAKSSII
jgi:hypothetical protein